MTAPRLDMIDLVFEISGGTLPVTYHYELWNALTQLAPQLAGDENVGVIPLRMSASNEGMLIPKRAKLALRLPAALAAIAADLSQKRVRVAGSELLLGSCKTRPIQHYPTLHAHLVTGAEDEIAFVKEIEAALAAMEVEANLICGQRHTLTDGSRSISGYSLVLHDLKPEDSLRVQYAGLGKERRFGCGIFIPYKVISGLE
ncbi:type I-MYXAN CRISPR-associated protein Cas6/Cmx6 [Sideroxyarcus emersonii]|nr:type I-MYXAN CRISPR-associated protein Cas6/Cmx6 [Sideroxyarcus emersonii]